MKCDDVTVFNDVDVQKRINHQGFLIDDDLYSYGGMSREGVVMN